MAKLDQNRLRRLTEQLLSSDVQVKEPANVEEVPARLSDKEVEKVFVDHVPGVRKFLFRGFSGQYSLKFMVVAYKSGLRAFQGTPLHSHLMWCMRLVVHHGHEGRPGARALLAEVAEAFLDCQAVQARAIERAGLRVRGLALDFAGLTTRLAGEYKTLALKMLAAERLSQGLATDYDSNPTHYENRLTADLGPVLGANADDVRRAALDGHASARYSRLRGDEVKAAAARCRELFDMEAMLQAFVAEVNRFGPETPSNSLPALFLGWISERLSQKHIVLDADTCSRTEVDCALALCIFEDLFLGDPAAPLEETFRGVPIAELFRRSPTSSGDDADEPLPVVAEAIRSEEPSPLPPPLVAASSGSFGGSSSFGAASAGAPLLGAAAAAAAAGKQPLGVQCAVWVVQWLLQATDVLWLGLKALLQCNISWYPAAANTPASRD